MYEHRTQPLLPLTLFFVRLSRSGSIALGLVFMAAAVAL